MTPRALRLVEAGARIATTPPKPQEIDFQHSTLCQTSLPHRPTTARTWEREQGRVSLRIEAGGVKRGSQWIDLPLPHGEKPRLLLIHLNTEAMRASSPIVNVERSMTAFVRAIGVDQNGPHIRAFKDQMTRLAAATVRFAVGDEQRTVQGQMHIVEKFELWWPKDERQRVMWPSELRLSDLYFRGLQRHAVPLDSRAIAALKGSSLHLDVYCWLAQRLHRIPEGKQQFVPWTALQEQFGQGYNEIRQFRAFFLKQLKQVKTVYQDANFDADRKGMYLCQSPPPVRKRLIALPDGKFLDLKAEKL
jgi:Plasmid encoded RepA protein